MVYKIEKIHKTHEFLNYKGLIKFDFGYKVN